MKNNYKFFQNRDCEFFPCHKIENVLLLPLVSEGKLSWKS